MTQMTTFPISMPADLVEDMPRRIMALEATTLCIAAALESEAEIDATQAATALRTLAREISGIYCALDVSTWPKGDEE